MRRSVLILITLHNLAYYLLHTVELYTVATSGHHIFKEVDRDLLVLRRYLTRWP